MPEVGERKTKNGVTGEWDGTTWRRVGGGSSAPVVGTRKTKDGVTGEWDGTTWRRVQAEPEPVEPETPSNWMAGVSALAGAGAAALPAAKALAERVATSPTIAALIGKAGGKMGALNPAYQAYEVLNGRKSVGAAVKDGVLTEAGRRAVGVIPKVAERVATGLGAEGVGGMAAPVAVPAAGGLAGVAGAAGFLAALQHDANRKVDIDYSKDTPDTWIARVLGGRSRDQRMDDPNDPMFQSDDQAVVTAKLLELLR